VTTEAQTRLDAGRLLAGLGGVLLIVSLFLDWYGLDWFGDAGVDAGVDASSGDGVTAWNSFELLDIVLAGLALVAIYAAFEALVPARWPRPPAAVARAAGPIALLLVFVAIVNKPPALLFVREGGLEIGIWLALAGTLLMTVGTLLSRVRVSFVVSSREPGERGPPPPGDRAEPASSADPAAETRVMGRRSEPPGL
jgi:hypothetical protein